MAPTPTPLAVLLVDDDEVDRIAVRRAVDGRGPLVTLYEAVSLEAAWQQLERTSFDCALVDFHLPDGTALDFLAKLSQQPPRLPVVVLTGDGDEPTAVATLSQGAQDYLLKGQTDPSSILRAIRYAIERQNVIELQSRLQHADRLAAVGQLAAGVAHEVNNPLTYLLANTAQLKDDLKQLTQALTGLPQDSTITPRELLRHPLLSRVFSDAQELLDENLEGLERIRGIIKNLRSFSRIEPDRFEDCRIEELIDVACGLVLDQTPNRPLIIKDYATLPPQVADRTKLTQLLCNLLLNASQALEESTKSERTIRIVTQQLAGQVQVTIEDNGPGICEQDLKRVFEPYYTTKRRTHGTGLGLSLCLEIARRHGGEIKISSRVGVGTQATVTLPVKAVAVNAIAPDERPSERMRLRARVLVIDDEELVCRSYRRVLEPLHEVTVALGGAEAIELLARDPNFDVVICDLMMPGVDGLAVHHFLRQKRSPLLSRLIFASGGALTDEARSFVAQARNMCLDKPLSRELLLSVVTQVNSVRPRD